MSASETGVPVWIARGSPFSDCASGCESLSRASGFSVISCASMAAVVESFAVFCPITHPTRDSATSRQTTIYFRVVLIFFIVVSSQFLLYLPHLICTSHTWAFLALCSSPHPPRGFSPLEASLYAHFTSKPSS